MVSLVSPVRNTFLRILPENCFGIETSSLYGLEDDIASSEELSKLIGQKVLAEEATVEELRGETRLSGSGASI